MYSEYCILGVCDDVNAILRRHHNFERTVNPNPECVTPWVTRSGKKLSFKLLCQSLESNDPQQMDHQA